MIFIKKINLDILKDKKNIVYISLLIVLIVFAFIFINNKDNIKGKKQMVKNYDIEIIKDNPEVNLNPNVKISEELVFKLYNMLNIENVSSNDPRYEIYFKELKNVFRSLDDEKKFYLLVFDEEQKDKSKNEYCIEKDCSYIRYDNKYVKELWASFFGVDDTVLKDKNIIKDGVIIASFDKDSNLLIKKDIKYENKNNLTTKIISAKTINDAIVLNILVKFSDDQDEKTKYYKDYNKTVEYNNDDANYRITFKIDNTTHKYFLDSIEAM